MKILAIESSCDETAAAVIEDGVKILSNVVVSQIDIFAEYGGVIPEVAARSHLEVILPVVHKALKDAGVTKEEIDAIAVTHTPGLMGSLLIGTLTARVLAILWGKPLYAVHHLKSHIYANWLDHETPQKAEASSDKARHVSPPLRVPCANPRRGSGPLSEEHQLSEESHDLFVLPQFPLVALVVSGGHTQIIYMKAHNQFEIIGTTRDDAVGECFDKVAKILGLPYPGGPSIASCALGHPYNSSSETVALSSSKDSDPRQPGNSLQMSHKGARFPTGDPWIYQLPHPKVEGLDFSFSGLKTAVLRAVQTELDLPITTPSYELAEKLTEQQRADFAASFQETACDILLDKLEMALRAHQDAKSLVFAGGVSANKVLREKAQKRFLEASDGEIQRPIYFPEPKFSGDNAAMVGAAAYFEIKAGVKPTDPYKLSIAPRTAIG